MADYEYDIFVSYRRLPAYGAWTRHWFKEKLDAALQPRLYPCRIYFDSDEEVANQPWPSKLRSAHARSKVLVCLLCRSYFDSLWCRYELTTMLDRMKRVEQGGGTATKLVVPVVFDDGKEFDPEIAQLSPDEIHDFLSEEVRRTTRQYRQCEAWMRGWVEKVWRAIEGAPPYDPAFEAMEAERFHRTLAMTTAAQQTPPRFKL